MKEKSGGFFSGLIKSAKHAADEISGDVKEFVDETKKEAVEEEARVRGAISEKIKDVDAAADQLATDVTTTKDKVKADAKNVKATASAKVSDGVQKVSSTGKAVGGKISDSAKHTVEFMGSTAEEMVTGAQRASDAGRSFGDKLSTQVEQKFVVAGSDLQGSLSDFLEEMKRDAAWDKVHFQDKPDVHVYENVDTSTFVRETRPESKGVPIPKHGRDITTTETITSTVFDTYDPFSGLGSEAQIRLSEAREDDRASESKSKKVSRIPQKVSSSKDRIVSTSSSTDSTVRVVNVFSEIEHLEPHTRQTVTTVVTKSVRTAATPPPSPAEYTDSRIEGILQ